MSKYVDPSTGKPPGYMEEKPPEEEKPQKKGKIITKRKYFDPTTGKPPSEEIKGSLTKEEKTMLKTRRSITQAEAALEQAESLKDAGGAEITWGEETFDLGTMEGWRAYRQRLRDYRSEISRAKRGLWEYRTAVIGSRRPEPYTDTVLPFTRAGVAKVGPPQVATEADRRRLEAEGYTLPEDRTVYISPTGEPYYYEEEIPDAPMSLSAKLWAEAMATPESATGRLLGVLPYRKRGTKVIGGVITGAAERAATPLLGLIPGEQPLELMPGEDSLSLYDIAAAEELTEAEKRVALATGVAVEAAASYALFRGANWVGGAAIGTGGALVGRTPWLGPVLASKGVSDVMTAVGVGLTFHVAVTEGERVIDIVKADKAVGYELLMEASRVAGSITGFTRGLSFGKTVPARVERALFGGTTVPETAIVPGYVTEEGGFPRFSEEPFKPTAKGYREMAEAYAPPELRVTETGVPSWHATPSRIKGETAEGFVSMVGERPGEAGMFYAPGASKHFLRLDGGYSLSPGLPNIFTEPQLVYGEFPGVEATGLGKSSSELAKLLQESAGTGKLLMPGEQMSEAQAILGPGTEMTRVAEGRFWADIGGKPVKLQRFLPKGVFPEVPTAETMIAEQLFARHAETVSSLIRGTPTTYIPIISPVADRELKRVESEMRRVSASVSKPSGSFTTTSSMDISVPTIPSIPGVTVSSRTTRRKPSTPSRRRPSRGGPSPTLGLPSVDFPSPSTDYPSPSDPGYGPTTPSYPSRGIPSLPTTPDYPGVDYPAEKPYRPEPTRKKKKKGRKKRRGAAERRLDPLAWTFPPVKMPDVAMPRVPASEAAVPKMKDVEFKVEVPKLE